MAEQIPGWFQESMVILFGKYQSATLSRGNVLGYWDELGAIDPEAVKRAMRQAPAKLTEKAFVPSAAYIAELAACIAKTLGPKPDYSRPALEEHDACDELPAECRERFEAAKALTGDERRKALARICNELVASL